jgi:hypothetical protein
MLLGMEDNDISSIVVFFFTENRFQPVRDIGKAIF